MEKYTFDIRPTTELLKRNEFTDLLSQILPQYKTFEFEDKHRANICYADLKVGMHLYLYDEGPDQYGYRPDYRAYEIEITHLYGNVIFFRRIDYPELEEYLPAKCFAANYNLYPYEIIKTSDTTVICKCDKTIITDDDDISSIGSYSTSYDFHDKEKFPKI